MNIRALILGAWALSLALLSFAKSEWTSEWMNPAKSASPVARPFDSLLMNPRGVEQSGDVLSSAQECLGDSGERAFSWHTQLCPGAPASAKSWATLRAAFLNETFDIEGVRLVFRAQNAGDLTVDFFSNVRTGSFWSAKREDSQTLAMRAGENDLSFIYKGDCPVGGFGLRLTEFPQTLEILRVDLIFRNAEGKRAYEQKVAAHAYERYDVMLQWLAGRGIALPLLPNEITTLEAERSLWTAVQVLSMREQVNYWLRMCKLDLSAEKLAERGNALSVRTERLCADAAGLSPQEFLTETDALQTDVDKWCDEVMQAIPVERRRWDNFVNKKTFTYPDGKPYRMFGPAYFRSIYHRTKHFGGSLKMARLWDMRYLSALGFNGLRLMVVWAHLEPERGKFDADYVAMLKEIMAQAERYGIGVSIDLHWEYPEWFQSGKEGYTVNRKNADHHNSYHWDEGLIGAWRLFGETFKDVPNIVAYEVPTNETSLARTSRGVLAYPFLNHQWNQWLKRTYGTREALAKAWNVPSAGGANYALEEDESWDNDSVRPLGYQKDSSPDSAYANNPRFWDHVRWAAWMQESVTGGIMKALRASIPHAEGMMQYTIGDVWDKSPIPVNYKSLSTMYGSHVLPGTHYGMGGIDAHKAASLTLKSYDSEQQMENREGQVARHLELGLGFCPFAFHARGGGGMLFSDDDWYLKREVLHLPLSAEFIRNYWPEPPSSPKVAYVQNTRRAAASKDTFGQLPSLVKDLNWSLGVFEGLRIVKDPSLLKPYDAVILDAKQLDADLLRVLMDQYKGRVLLYGSLAQDAYAREGEYGTAAALARAGILFKGDLSQISKNSSSAIDLSGVWDWRYDGMNKKAPKKPPLMHGKWEKKNVPGTWGEETILGSSQFRLGDAWYRKSVVIPKEWKGRSLKLELGAVDDFDWVFFNGKLIGHTGAERHNWWEIPRNYPIPERLVRWGAENEIFICVRNTADDAGIIKLPVCIASGDVLESVWPDGARMAMQPDPDANLFSDGDVGQNAEVLARIGRNGEECESPALLRDGRWYWWVGGTPWSAKDESAVGVLKKFLSNQ